MFMRLTLRTCAAVLLAGCASTEFTNTWKAPDGAPLSIRSGDTVLAVVVSKDEVTRRGGEDALSSELRQRALRAISSYTLVPTPLVGDKEIAIQAIRSSGAAAVLVVRPVSVHNELRWVDTSTAGPGGFVGFWGSGWASSGYLTSDTIVQLETLVFDVRQDKLLWGGTSRTTNPDKIPQLAHELVEVVTDQLRKAGVLSASAT